MRYFVVTSLVVVLLVLLSSNTGCGGRLLVAECNGPGEGPGYNLCTWDPADLPPGKQSQVCCPPNAPYCGGVGLNCPPGWCCTNKPEPGPVVGGPEYPDASAD